MQSAKITLLSQRDDRIVALLHYIVMWMMSGYLLADMLSGVSLIYLGLDLKVSLIYKTPLFGLLLVLIGRYQFKLMLAIISVIMVLMIGPVASYFSVLKISLLFADFAYVVKIVMPMTVLAYFYVMSQLAPEWALKWAKRILWCGFFALLVNFMFGALGFGKATYNVGGEQEGAGSTGFMMAGNELGATYLLLFGFALHYAWNHKSLMFFSALAFTTVLCGVLVATKTTMLASLILIFMIPIVNERANLYRLTWLKIKIIIPVLIITIVVVVMIVEILESVGLWERMLWFYQKRGVIMIIWSNRDQFIIDMMQVYIHQSSLFEQFFGQGISIGLKQLVGKGSVEVDIVDSLIWFGFLGALFCSSFYILLLSYSAKLARLPDSQYAPCVFLVNSLLMLLSILSGHIWMSGTIGIVVGVLNSLLWFELKKSSSLSIHCA
jgi:hypothetical protein